MLKIHNPASIAAPISRFHHGVEVPSPATLLYISGQVGIRPDGRLAEGPRPQIEQAWRNVLAIVDSAGMVPSDLVKVTAYLTRMSDVDVYRDVRNELLPDITTASTLLIVAGLASLGLPALSGFVAEFTVFAGTIQAHPAATIFGVFGVVLAAGYILWAVQRVFTGPPDERWSGLTDAEEWWEYAAMAAMLIFIIGVGVYPRLLTDVVESGVEPIALLVQAAV